MLAVALATKAASGPTAGPAATTLSNPSVAGIVASPVTPRSLPASPPTGLPPRNPNAAPFPAPPTFALPAGETVLAPPGPSPAVVTLSLPDGWHRAGTTVVLKPSSAKGADLSVGAWQVRQVDTFACRWASQPRADAASMSTAEALAQELSQWWGQDPGNLPYWNSPLAPLASKPKDTTFAGHPAWSLQILVPSGLDLAECDGGQLVLWEAANGEVRTGLPGELHELWVIDAAGGPIVIDFTSSATAPPKELAELEAIIGSIEIR